MVVLIPTLAPTLEDMIPEHSTQIHHREQICEYVLHSILCERVYIIPSHGVDNGDLFVAVSTIMGFAVFGSALSTFGSNKELMKGVANILIVIIAVQMIFMFELMGFAYFPIVVWIPVTAILLMLVVFAIITNKVRSDEDGGDNRKGSLPN